MKKFIFTSSAILCCLSAFSQSGQKWSAGGNGLASGDFLGSTNSFPLIFKVNNNQQMSLGVNGEFRLNHLAVQIHVWFKRMQMVC